jgi:hypothetical protein
MRAWGLGLAAGIAACMSGSLTSTSYAQQGARQHPPIVRIYSSNGVDLIGTPTYITPEIQVSENSYIFAVLMDLDGQIRVLHPELPGISVKVSSHTQLRLPNFWAGYNQTPTHNQYGYSGYAGPIDDTRGTVLALASRAPFQLDVISSGGDWDFATIRRMIENRTPQEALMVLADYLGAKDQPIGRDFMRFSGGGASNAYAYNEYYDSYGGYGYDSYGSYYGYLPWPLVVYGGLGRNYPRKGYPRTTGDTTVFPKARFPHGRPTAAEGHFPMPGRAGGPQTIPAQPPPQRYDRRASTSEYRDGRYPQAAVAAPQGRAPVERTIYRREAATATGSMPGRASPPARTYSAPPVTHERASSPPPSRVAPAPAPTPPPRTHGRQ